MIKAVIFDLDGTLLDTLDDLMDAVNHVLEKNYYPVHTKDEIRNYVGNGIGKLMERSIPQGKSDSNYENLLKELKTYYKENCLIKTKPYPVVLEMLNQLKEKNVQLGIVSNKPDFEVKNLAGIFFPMIDKENCVGDNFVRKIKPEPDGLFQVMNSLKVSKDEVIYVGDSEVDILTAKNADVKCVNVTWGFRDRELLVSNGATCLVDSPLQIVKMI